MIFLAGVAPMRATDAVSTDLIQELRLRKWAREHYVNPGQRGRNWHPIVLEEMGFRDEELRADQVGRELPCSPYVPLAPLDAHFLDEPHAAVPEPKSLAAMTGNHDARALEDDVIPVSAPISSHLADRRIRP